MSTDPTHMIVTESVACPCCGERISIAIDTSVPQQQYVEDCSVCCRPLVVTFDIDDGRVAGLDVTPES